MRYCLIFAIILAGCRAPSPPALMSPATRAEADALMRPNNLMDRASGARGVPSVRRIVNATPEPVSIMPPASKALTSRVVTHPPPVAITNVTVTWNLAPVLLYPVMLHSTNNLTAPLFESDASTVTFADFLGEIQGPTNSVRLVGLLVASTNGWRSQYQVTPDMVYVASNGVVRRVLNNEQLKAGYRWTR